MSAGNWGVVEHLIQGFLASSFNKDSNGVPVTTNPSDQGATASIFLDQIRLVATRADLTQANIKVAAPQWFDGTNDVDVSTSACVLLGAVAMTNATNAEDAFITFYNTNTPTEGTTRYLAGFNVPAGGTAATAKIQAVVYPVPVAFDTALTWSAVDNGSDTDIEGTALADANGVLVMVVYAV